MKLSKRPICQDRLNTMLALTILGEHFHLATEPGFCMVCGIQHMSIWCHFSAARFLALGLVLIATLLHAQIAPQQDELPIQLRARIAPGPCYPDCRVAFCPVARAG